MKSNLLLFISIPFTLGVFLFTYLSSEWKNFLPLTSLLGLLPFLFLFLTSRQKHGHNILLIILFFSLGCLSAQIHYLIPVIPEENFFNLCRKALQEKINTLPLSEQEHKALICALLSGGKSTLSWEIKQNFRKSGASHLLALSGLHLGIISTIMDRCLSVLGKNRKSYALRQLLLILSCGFYTLVCGASPSLLRAFLFILYRSVGRLLPERKAPAINALLLACLIQLNLDPSAVKSLSFQLSYLASLSLISLYPRLKGWLPAGKGLSGKIWDSISISISCQLFTAPVVYLHFNALPKYFLLTNLLALPICELLIILSVVLLTTSSLGFSTRLLCITVDTCAEILLNLLEKISSIP
ncbi:MAG: ComEC/Rec2 family competence protein [Candidatus Cryptobacteroides sp.]